MNRTILIRAREVEVGMDVRYCGGVHKVTSIRRSLGNGWTMMLKGTAPATFVGTVGVVVESASQ